MPELTQDSSSLMPPGDFSRLDKRQREAFNKLQERCIAYLLEESNTFRLQFPQMEVHFALHMDVFSNPKEQPATIRYSSRVY